MTTISEIVLHRLRIPLTVPYKLSFVELRAFDTILVEMHDGDGPRRPAPWFPDKLSREGNVCCTLPCNLNDVGRDHHGNGAGVGKRCRS